MSPYLIRTLLENSIATAAPESPDHVESKARTIDSIMTSLLGSAECLGRLGSAIEATAERTVLPTLEVAIEAARLADEGKSFAAMARDLKNLADQSTLSSAGILAQCEAALELSKQAADALQDVVGSLPDGVWTQRR